ncbi:response regulator [Aminobacter sp. Piv2-1]|uniref:response regulator n=1 Tax=Aminobacter sp. Piv2-1 TaxID=3031122 RepID=UPI00403FA20F
MHSSEHVVLVVDDHPLISMDTAGLVVSCGCTTIEAVNADHVVAYLERRSDIRCVLTDVEMPGGMDGIGLAQLIRTRWADIAIVVVSGRTLMDSEDLPDEIPFLAKLLRRGCLRPHLRI